MDNTNVITSVAMGFGCIKKHFTLDRSGAGADDSFSIQPSELSL
jgi:pseudaminic acid synthase